ATPERLAAGPGVRHREFGRTPHLPSTRARTHLAQAIPDERDRHAIRIPHRTRPINSSESLGQRTPRGDVDRAASEVGHGDAEALDRVRMPGCDGEPANSGLGAPAALVVV